MFGCRHLRVAIFQSRRRVCGSRKRLSLARMDVSDMYISHRVGTFWKISVSRRFGIEDSPGGGWLNWNGGVSRVAMDMGLFPFHLRASVPRDQEQYRDEFAFLANTHQKRRLHHRPNPPTYSLPFWLFCVESPRLVYQFRRFRKSNPSIPCPEHSAISSCYRLSSQGCRRSGRSCISTHSSNRMPFSIRQDAWSRIRFPRCISRVGVTGYYGIQWFYVHYAIRRLSSGRPISSRAWRDFARIGYTADSRRRVRKIRIPAKVGTGPSTPRSPLSVPGALSAGGVEGSGEAVSPIPCPGGAGIGGCDVEEELGSATVPGGLPHLVFTFPAERSTGDSPFASSPPNISRMRYGHSITQTPSFSPTRPLSEQPGRIRRLFLTRMM